MKTTQKYPTSIPLDQSLDAGTSEDLLRELRSRGLRTLIEHSLEAEIDEYLERKRSERRTEGSRRAYRNGTTPSTLRTQTGRIPIDRPRVRSAEPEQPIDFESVVWSRLDRLEAGLERLTIELYTRGLSTRDIEQTLVDEDGRPLISRSSVSRITDELYQEYEAFRSRDLSEIDAVYLFCDGVYESVRRYTKNQALLCAWAICADGTKQLLHLAAVESESERAWSTFFDEMIDRGLRHPLLVVSDGAKGLHAAVTRAFPHADRQRCLAHKLRNLASKLPDDVQKEVLSSIKQVYYCTDRKTAEVLAQAVIEQYAASYPSMIQCFQDDLDACLVHLNYPLGHRKFIRTTNLLERAFEEQKRRTKVLPQHEHEKAALKLVFAVLLRASKTWTRVRMTELERTQLRHLRTLMTKSIRTTETNYDNNYISFRIAA